MAEKNRIKKMSDLLLVKNYFIYIYFVANYWLIIN